MKKIRFVALSLTGLAILTTVGLGIASAAIVHGGSHSKDVGKSGIPRSTFRNDELQAAASVLNTTTANVQTAHKDKNLKTMVKDDGLTLKQFRQQVKARLTSELESQGYSKNQVEIALQSQDIKHLHQRLHHLQKS